MRNLQHYGRFSRTLFLEAVGLEKMTVIKTVALILIEILFSRKDQHLTMRLVVRRLPEGEEASRLVFRLY